MVSSVLGAHMTWKRQWRGERRQRDESTSRLVAREKTLEVAGGREAKETYIWRGEEEGGGELCNEGQLRADI